MLGNTLKYLGFFLVLIVPAFTKPILIEGVNSPRLLLANLFLLIPFFERKKIKLESSMLYALLFFALYLCYKIISLTYVVNTAAAIFSCQLTFFFLCALLLFFTYAKHSNLNVFLKGVIISNIISLFYLGIEVWNAGGFHLADPYELSSIFSYKNTLSAYLFLCSAIGAYWAFSKRNAYQLLMLILITINFCATYYLQSRSVLLAFVFAILLFGIFSVRKKTWRIVIAIIGLILISAAITFVFNRETLVLSSLDSIEERLKLWQKTTQLISENFFLGVGAGNWQFNFSKFGINNIYMLHQSKVSFQSPHNEFLWLISEGGIIAVGLIVLSLIFYTSAIVKKRKVTVQTKILLAALSGSLPIVFFSFPSERMMLLLVYALLFVLLARTNQSQSSKKVLPQSVKYGFALLCLCSSIIAAYQIKGEFYVRKMIQAQKHDHADPLLRYAEKSKSWCYQNDSRSTPISSYEGWAYQKKGAYKQMLLATQKAHLLAPYDFEILSNYGYALMKMNEFKKAEEKLLAAYTLNNYHDPIKINLCVLYFNQGNYWEALQWIEEVPHFKTRYPAIFKKIIGKLSFPRETN